MVMATKVNTLLFYDNKAKIKFQQFNHKQSLLPYFIPMIEGKKEVKILDIGCGLVCSIGNLAYNTKIEITASDILADDYNAIINKHGLIPMIPVQKENMEKLSYRSDSFDIVHCVNAIDHTGDPMTAIREMIRVCIPGGFVYLRHFENVGEHEGYKGMHQWNLNYDQYDDCIFWSNKDRFSLKSINPKFRTKVGRELSIEPPTMVISILQK